MVRGRDRIQTIIASCNPRDDAATPLLDTLRPLIEEIELPTGYTLEWAGEYASRLTDRDETRMLDFPSPEALTCRYRNSCALVSV